MNQGSRRADICKDDLDRQRWLQTLGERRVRGHVGGRLKNLRPEAGHVPHRLDDLG